MSNSIEHWAVEVRTNGESILTIESNSMCGKVSLTDEELGAIRTAAKHLLWFAGDDEK